MRPIDADVMAEQLNMVTDDDNKTVLFLGEAKKIVHELVTQQPTIDAIHVIRCKNCKHYNLQALACTHDNFNGTIGMDGFCSYGERKE